MERINRDDLAKATFGMSRTAALERGICISCRQPIAGRLHTEAGRREYMISAVCEPCFDAMFPAEEEDE
jgi:hypothetical protein